MKKDAGKRKYHYYAPKRWFLSYIVTRIRKIGRKLFLEKDTLTRKERHVLRVHREIEAIKKHIIFIYQELEDFKEED